MIITPQQAKAVMEQGGEYTVLDVRDGFEYDQGHIPGAVVIPFTELENRAEGELPDKGKTILVYCRTGRRSAIAAEILANLGYTDVRDFGGILDWPYETQV